MAAAVSVPEQATCSSLAPQVFISYTHDPSDPSVSMSAFERGKKKEEHRLYVYLLSQYLREHGVDCTIDQYVEDDPPHNWGQWMEEKVKESDHVIMVCSPAYCQYISGRGESREGM